jgi:hypothetical protein
MSVRHRTDGCREATDVETRFNDGCRDAINRESIFFGCRDAINGW